MGKRKKMLKRLVRDECERFFTIQESHVIAANRMTGLYKGRDEVGYDEVFRNVVDEYFGGGPVKKEGAVRITDDDSAHVMPCGDRIEHVTDPDCPCGPTPELVKRFLRPDGWLYVHHSLDGRERREGNPNVQPR